MIKVVILGDQSLIAWQKSHELALRLGFIEVVSSPEGADIAIAPLLTRILRQEDISAPRIGTLIFHPSPLPYGRGKSSIKCAYRRSEPITAATWFWCNREIDAGDICEIEIVRIDYEKRPSEFYMNDVIPAMLRTLERALIAIGAGIIRRVPQVESYSSYD